MAPCMPSVTSWVGVTETSVRPAGEKRGVWAYYRVVPDALGGLADLLASRVAVTPASRAPGAGAG
jgi:hypothetical protein